MPYFFQTSPPLLKLLLAQQLKNQKHQEKARENQGICGAQEKSKFPELVRQVFVLDDKAALHTGESPTASQTFRDPDQKMLGGSNANLLRGLQPASWLPKRSSHFLTTQTRVGPRHRPQLRNLQRRGSGGQAASSGIFSEQEARKGDTRGMQKRHRMRTKPGD